ncbi:hypothetical protein DFJ77DRAFT_265128 [Powellomyces hirtus]|nr:hypothetical protein DFJ77DRAFT_265128 [Powellomyces hirtus]
MSNMYSVRDNRADGRPSSGQQQQQQHQSSTLGRPRPRSWDPPTPSSSHWPADAQTLVIPRIKHEKAMDGSIAIGTLGRFCDKARIPAPVYTLSGSAPFSARLLVAGIEFNTEGFPSKVEAKRTVAWAAVEHFKRSGEPFFLSDDGEDYISLLMSYCTIQKSGKVSFDHFETPENPPMFMARVVIGDGMVFEDGKSHPTKQVAKAAVAKLALEALKSGKYSKPRQIAYSADWMRPAVALSSPQRSGAGPAVALSPPQGPGAGPRLQVTYGRPESYTDPVTSSPPPPPPPLPKPVQPDPPVAIFNGEPRFEEVSATSESLVTGGTPSSGVVHNLLSSLVYGKNAKRTRVSSASDSEPEMAGAGSRGRFPTYCGLLEIECFQTQRKTPQYTFVPEDGGFRCETQIDDRVFRTTRVHERQSTAKEDVAGDAYKWLRNRPLLSDLRKSSTD